MLSRLVARSGFLAKGKQLFEPRSLSKIVRTEDAYRQSFRGQLKPILPPMSEAAAVIQRGPYASQWVRVRQSGLSSAELKELMAQEEKSCSGALYLCIPQQLLPSVASELLPTVLANSYTFHHHDRHTDEFVWYKWCHPERHDCVPSYATAIGGAGALPISPDSRSVLLVKEYGVWSRAGGSVDPGESALSAAQREVFEETGLQLDDSFHPLFALGGNQAKSRDQIINDQFVLFVFRAQNQDVKLEQEVSEARWFDISSLATAWDQFRAQRKEDKLPSTLAVDGEFFSAFVLEGLSRFLKGTCHPLLFIETGNLTPRIIY